MPRRIVQSPVEPITSVEELIDVVSATIENVADAMDLERIVDAIARFHHHRPTDFDARVGALRERIEKLSDQYSRSVLDLGADIGFSQILRTWLGMPPILRERDDWQSGLKTLTQQRMTELGWFLQRNDEPSCSLLAMPTHIGGWIDPVMLAEKIVSEYVTNRRMPDHYDLAAAMLRLMPDGRSEAIETLGKPDTYNGGPQLQYALGSSVNYPDWGGYGETAMRLAATRARSLTMSVSSNDVPARLASVSFAPTSPEGRDGLTIEGPAAVDPAMPRGMLEWAFSNYQVERA